MKKIVIGIDVSKEKLDFCVKSAEKVIKELVVQNTTKAIGSSLKSIEKEYQLSLSDLLICAEYTGQYIYPLCCVCAELKVDLWLENPAQIKLSSGFQRGKNDKIDARKIADYALRYQDRVRLFSLPQKRIESLKHLISERDMYLSDKRKYQGQLTDQERFMSKEDYRKKRTD